jgi:putative lipase involved disintegration of autophagic bodies
VKTVRNVRNSLLLSCLATYIFESSLSVFNSVEKSSHNARDHQIYNIDVANHRRLHKDADGAAHVKISQLKKELEECRRSQYDGQQWIDNVEREERESDERYVILCNTKQHARFRLIRRRKGMPNAALSFQDLSGQVPEGFR